MQPKIFSIAVIGLALISTGPASSQDLLSLQLQDLNGASVKLPGDLPTGASVLLVGFHHGEQPGMDAWRDGLQLQDTESNWLELPVIGEMNSLVKTMIREGMRGKFKTAAQRAHVAPVFAPVESVAGPLGVSTEGISVVVIDRTGHVLACQTGDYTAEKAAALSHALRAVN
jgi:hypothetical protein